MFSFILDLILSLSLEALWDMFSHASASLLLLKLILRRLPLRALKRLKRKKILYWQGRILQQAPECPRCKEEGLPDIRSGGEMPLHKHKMPLLEWQLLKLGKWIWPNPE